MTRREFLTAGALGGAVALLVRGFAERAIDVSRAKEEVFRGPLPAPGSNVRIVDLLKFHDQSDATTVVTEGLVLPQVADRQLGMVKSMGDDGKFFLEQYTFTEGNRIGCHQLLRESRTVKASGMGHYPLDRKTNKNEVIIIVRCGGNDAYIVIDAWQ